MKTKPAAAAAAKTSANPLKKLRRRDIEQLRVIAQDGGDIHSAVTEMLRAYSEREREYQRRWRDANQEKLKAQWKRYRKKHRAQLTVKSQQYRAGHPEGQARMRARSIEKRKAALRTWVANNKDKTKLYHYRKRQRTKAIAFLKGDPAEVQRIIRRQLPSYLDASARNDIVAEVCLAIMARKILFVDLSTCAKPFVAAHNRMFDHFKNISLDAPLPGTDLLRIDTIADPATV